MIEPAIVAVGLLLLLASERIGEAVALPIGELALGPVAAPAAAPVGGASREVAPRTTGPDALRASALERERDGGRERA